MQQLDVRMILAIREHTGNDPALLSDPEAALGAQRFDVDGLVQNASREWMMPRTLPARDAHLKSRSDGRFLAPAAALAGFAAKADL
ncbi:MAG: hypothetical protein ACXU6W_09685, partial [Croceibacterium sp.]